MYGRAINRFVKFSAVLDWKIYHSRQWNDFYVNIEYVSFQLKVSGVNCYNYPRCWSMFIKFYRQILLTESVNHPIGPLGTFVSHFASAMGGSFR